MTLLASRDSAGALARSNRTPDPTGTIASGARTVQSAINALTQLRASLDNGLGLPFQQAVQMIANTRGRVIVTGIGKSGHIGSKIAATLASTGTAAFFVHPGEASHGDLGMLLSEDTVVALSWSGETPELASIIEYAGRFRLNVIAITSNADSALGRAADLVLKLPPVPEACLHGLAATNSALVQMAIGDALAIALQELRGFTAEDFRERHPGGLLGAKLRTVRSVMHGKDQLPLAKIGTSLREAIPVMTARRLGCLGIVAEDGRLVGIVTDGDLRRNLDCDVMAKKVEDIMTPDPRTIGAELLAGAALQQLNENQITVLFVVEDARPIGIVHLHDLLRIGTA